MQMDGKLVCIHEPPFYLKWSPNKVTGHVDVVTITCLDMQEQAKTLSTRKITKKPERFADNPSGFCIVVYFDRDIVCV